MRSWMIAFAAGVIAVGVCARLPLPESLAIGIALNLGAHLVARHFRLRSVAALTGCLMAMLTGALWHTWHAERVLSQRLPPAIEGLDTEVSGRVASLTEQRAIGLRFQFVIEAGQEELRGRRILLNYYGEELVAAGERWRFTVRLNRPHGSSNPGTFDYEAWLFGQRIAARGYVRDAEGSARLAASGVSILSLRSALRSRIDGLISDLDTRAVLLALCLGDRSRIDDAQWELFSATGTNHLVVVSGLHVAMMAALSYLLTVRAWRLSSRLCLTWPAQRAGALAAIVGALAYSLLAGFTLPTQRALTMVCVFMLARVTGRYNRPQFSFLVALTVVLLIDPLAAIGSGFWLSFSAVAVLLLSLTGRSITTPAMRLTSLWSRWCKPQLVVFIGLLIPLGVWIGSIPLLSPLANLVAIPLVSWLVVPLALLGLAAVTVAEPLAGLAFALADGVLTGLFAGMKWLTSHPALPNSVPVAPLTALQVVIATGGVLLWLLPRIGASHLLGILMIAPLFLQGSNAGPKERLAVHILDVGQGLAVIVRTPNHTLVYDTGPRFVSGFDSGAATVAPVLRHLGVRQVDRLIISHGDNDHAGGAGGLFAALPIESILAGEALPALDAEVLPCRAGDSWEWDGVEFRILHPSSSGRENSGTAESGITGSGTAESRTARTSTAGFDTARSSAARTGIADSDTAGFGTAGNNSSCVLSISTEGFIVLLPGDIEASVERLLSARALLPEQVDLLVSAHHGSNTSSTWTLLAATWPELVIHSAGYRNQFRHPAWQVRQRFGEIGAWQLGTAELGMISVSLKEGAQKPVLESHRLASRRYWNWSEFARQGR